MAERGRENIIEAANHELGKTLERWKYCSTSVEDMARLNTVFDLAERAGINIELEVEQFAVFTDGDDFLRILPQEAMIHGKEKGNAWVFKTEAKTKGLDPHVLSASNAGGEPLLVFYHMNHGTTGHFLPSDVISIKLQ